MEFTPNNSGDYPRSIIFGGLLDRCTPDPCAEILAHPANKGINGVTNFELISNINDTNSISSSPVRVCFCTPDDRSDCNYEPPIIQVKKGESFNVSLVAVDQVNHTAMDVTIHSSFNYAESGLGRVN